MWTIFSFYWICYNIAAVVLVLVLWSLGGLWDHSSLSRGQTCISALEGEILALDCQGNLPRIFPVQLIWNHLSFHLPVYSISILSFSLYLEVKPNNTIFFEWHKPCLVSVLMLMIFTWNHVSHTIYWYYWLLLCILYNSLIYYYFQQ